MTAGTAIAVCEHLCAEVRAALDASGGVDVPLVVFPAACEGTAALPAPLVRRVAERGLALRVLGAACIDGLAGAATELAGAGLTLEREPQCFYLLAPPRVIDDLQRAGAHLVTPGWLRRWRRHLAAMGLDAQAAAALFQEGATSLVLLDTGVDPGAELALRELAAHLSLPARTLDVGLEPLGRRLAGLIAAPQPA